MPEKVTVTSREARALRNADSICFDLRKDGGALIRAIRRGSNTASGFEEVVAVAVESCRVNDYSRVTEGPYVGFAMIMSALYDPIWQTVGHHIRAGSRLGLVWTRDNSSPVTEQAGIVVDMLDIQVQNGNRCGTFRVSTYIGRDNTARMLRPIS